MTTNSRPAPEIVTLGCRLNAYESEVMRNHASDAGLEDAIIINTCAVTAEAVRQAAQTIRRRRRESPQARIIVTGCAAQIEPQRFADMPEVDHVIGNAEKLEAKTFLDLATEGGERVRVNDIMSVRETAGHLIDGFATRVRAYVQIQNGCDHRCTFCIIPFGRGPSRSVPAGEIIDQIRRLGRERLPRSRPHRRRHHLVWQVTCRARPRSADWCVRSCAMCRNWNGCACRQ